MVSWKSLLLLCLCGSWDGLANRGEILETGESCAFTVLDFRRGASRITTCYAIKHLLAGSCSKKGRWSCRAWISLLWSTEWMDQKAFITQKQHLAFTAQSRTAPTFVSPFRFSYFGGTIQSPLYISHGHSKVVLFVLSSLLILSCVGWMVELMHGKGEKHSTRMYNSFRLSFFPSGNGMAWNGMEWQIKNGRRTGVTSLFHFPFWWDCLLRSPGYSNLILGTWLQWEFRHMSFS